MSPRTIVPSPRRLLLLQGLQPAPAPNVIQLAEVRAARSRPHAGLHLVRSGGVQPPVRHLDQAQPGEVEVSCAEDVDALARGQGWID